MQTSPTNSHQEKLPVGPTTPPPVDGPENLVAEAEMLRTVLLDAAGRASRLVLVLKQQRRQTKALRAAMASLRGLGANV